MKASRAARIRETCLPLLPRRLLSLLPWHLQNLLLRRRTRLLRLRSLCLGLSLLPKRPRNLLLRRHTRLLRLRSLCPGLSLLPKVAGVAQPVSRPESAAQASAEPVLAPEHKVAEVA